MVHYAVVLFAIALIDHALQSEMKNALQNREDLEDITVEVKNCVARLTGTVPTEMRRLEAAVVARSTHGVGSVQNDLHVTWDAR